MNQRHDGETIPEAGQGDPAWRQRRVVADIARPSRRWIRFPLVLALLAVEVIVLYGPSIDDSLVADDWNILQARTSSLGAALALEPLGPHFLPLQYVIVFLLRQAVGIDPVAYRLVVLTLAWLSATLVAVLGRRLTGKITVGAVAAVIFLAYGTHFEATLWPVAGISYTLATVLALSSLLLYIHSHDPSVDRNRRKLTYLGFVTTALLAPLAYPLGITAIAGAALYRLFVLEQGVAIDRGSMRRRIPSWVRDFLAPALIAVGYLALITWLDPEEYAPVERTVGAQLRAFVKSLIHVALPAVGYGQVTDSWNRLDGVNLFPVVLIAGLAVAVFVLVRWGQPAQRFLAGWIAVMAAAMTVGLGTVFPRHLFLMTVPASLLGVIVLGDLAGLLREMLGRRGVPVARAAVIGVLPSAAIVLAIVVAGSFASVRQRQTWSSAMIEVDDYIAQVDRLAQAKPTASSLYLIDPPAARNSPADYPVYLLPWWSAAAEIDLRLAGRFNEIYPIATDPNRGGVHLPPDQLRAVASAPQALAVRYNRRDHRVNEWRPEPVAENASGLGAIDLVAGQAPPATVPVGQSVEVTGWAVLSPTAAAGGVIILVDAQPSATATYGRERPDVAAALGEGAPSAVGFVGTIPAAALQPGRHTLGLWIVSHDGATRTELAHLVEVNVVDRP